MMYDKFVEYRKVIYPYNRLSFLYHLNEIFIPKLDDCTALAHEEDEFGFTIFGTSLVVMQFETVGTIS